MAKVFTGSMVDFELGTPYLQSPGSAQQLIDSPDDLIARLGQRADPNTQLPNRYGDNLQRDQRFRW